MIKLTRSNDRDVWVEPSAIVMVESDGMKTTVTLAHGAMLLVKESVQHVLSERLKHFHDPGEVTWGSKWGSKTIMEYPTGYDPESPASSVSELRSGFVK